MDICADARCKVRCQGKNAHGKGEARALEGPERGLYMISSPMRYEVEEFGAMCGDDEEV